MNNTDVGRQAEVLVDDVIGRFKKGEVGTVIYNDSKKYDYFIELKRNSKYGNAIARNFYFYKSEVRIIEGVVG